MNGYYIGEIMIVNKKIIEKLKERDEETFELIYEHYYKLIYYVALNVTKDKEMASEIVQDTFMKMLTSIDTYDEGGKFKPWLCTIARNLSLNKVTRRKDKDVLYDEELVYSTKHSESKLMDYILTIKGSLTPEDANIVILKLVYNYKFREIAEEMGLSLGLVQARYYQAIKILKQVI